ncbi:MAG: hypothetical protein R3D34_18690 [Nitratireductor sp.]
MVGHDTGCITTLDKNQWIGKAVDKVYALPVMADCQFAARSPAVPIHTRWHNCTGMHRPSKHCSKRIGIDWEKARAEFETYLGEVKAGNIETLYDPKRAITSGPGYVRPALAGGDK